MYKFVDKLPMNITKVPMGVAHVELPVTTKLAVAITQKAKPTDAPSDTVSLSKVARMRAAIEAGTFKVDAGRIADAMLARGDI